MTTNSDMITPLKVMVVGPRLGLNSNLVYHEVESETTRRVKIACWPNSYQRRLRGRSNLTVTDKGTARNAGHRACRDCF